MERTPCRDIHIDTLDVDCFEKYLRVYPEGIIVGKGHESDMIGQYGTLVGGKIGYIFYKLFGGHYVKDVNGNPHQSAIWPNTKVCSLK